MTVQSLLVYGPRQCGHACTSGIVMLCCNEFVRFCALIPSKDHQIKRSINYEQKRKTKSQNLGHQKFYNKNKRPCIIELKPNMPHNSAPSHRYTNLSNSLHLVLMCSIPYVVLKNLCHSFFFAHILFVNDALTLFSRLKIDA